MLISYATSNKRAGRKSLSVLKRQLLDLRNLFQKNYFNLCRYIKVKVDWCLKSSCIWQFLHFRNDSNAKQLVKTRILDVVMVLKLISNLGQHLMLWNPKARKHWAIYIHICTLNQWNSQKYRKNPLRKKNKRKILKSKFSNMLCHI